HDSHSIHHAVEWTRRVIRRALYLGYAKPFYQTIVAFALLSLNKAYLGNARPGLQVGIKELFEMSRLPGAITHRVREGRELSHGRCRCRQNKGKKGFTDSYRQLIFVLKKGDGVFQFQLFTKISELFTSRASVNMLK